MPAAALGTAVARGGMITDDFPGSEGVINFGTCKYAYERVSTAPPAIGRCTPSPIGRK